MTILVVGASGATGKQLVAQLLDMGHHVKAIVRDPTKLPVSWNKEKRLTLIQANVLDISVVEMAEHLKDCHAVASCLGHNLTWKGLYGKPRELVTDAVRLLCNAIQKNESDQPVKLVLMNTTGNRNRDLDEPISVGQIIVIGLLRVLLPPHVDNEKAADFLRTKIGQNNQFIQWAAIRPDTLIDEESVSDYELHASPTRSAIFNAGQTSRINVGHFMARLIVDNALWNQWKGQMPVIYNTADYNKNK
ncbi:MAG: NAD(P)H-binding protein [Bacteroidetes bacterium]|nr:NAD(P)H-binding protein [Bacteroidota bacterium]